MGSDEMTPIEVARVFNVSSATVRRWENDGTLVPVRRLPGSGQRRYSRADVEALRVEQEQRDAEAARAAEEARRDKAEKAAQRATRRATTPE